MASFQYNDKVWKKLLKRVGLLAHARVRVGVLSGSGGDSPTESGLTMLDIAMIHEFGAPKAGIPERSFIRLTFEMDQSKLAKFTARLARLIILGEVSVERALSLLGEFGVSRVKKTIIDGVSPALAASTIAAKGSSKPLVNTGQLLNSIGHDRTKV